jgi:hypothetical protein
MLQPIEIVRATDCRGPCVGGAIRFRNSVKTENDVPHFLNLPLFCPCGTGDSLFYGVGCQLAYR